MTLLTLSDRDRAAALERALEDIKASRPAATRVLQLTDDPDADAGQVAAAIDVDPTLTAQVLRLANSAAFGLTSGVSSTQRAVSVVGFSAVRSIAVLLASGLRNHRNPTPDGFWQHAAASASSCAAISADFGVSRGEAFSLGLLHDLGWALLYGIDPGVYAPSGSGRPDSPEQCADEVEAFGLSHATAVATVLRRWSFADTFVDAISRHHEPADITTPTDRLLVAGDRLAHVVLDPAGPADADVTGLEAVGIAATRLERLIPRIAADTAEVLMSFPN